MTSHRDVTGMMVNIYIYYTVYIYIYRKWGNHHQKRMSLLWRQEKHGSAMFCS